MPAPPRPSFAAIAETGPDSASRLLARGVEALRRQDPASAWLVADLLVRAGSGAEAAPYLLRAAALARLGRPAESRRDLERASFCDPYDDAVNRALLAAGSPADRDRALMRLIEGTEGRWSADLAAAMARAGKGAAIVCVADRAGIDLSGWAAAPRTVALAWTGEDGRGTVELVIDQPAGETSPGMLGRTRVAWPAGASALAFGTQAHDVVVHPPTVHRPDADADGDAGHGGEPSRSGRALLIVVPVYDDLAATEACCGALRAGRPADRATRVVAVDDVTPDAAIAALLDRLAARGEIELIRNRINLGFAASVNRALGTRVPDEDVVLLNADTLVPPGALARLHDMVLADPALGTLTPLSNNGEDTSIPRRFAASPLGTDDEVAALNDLAWRVNAAGTAPMPNGVGFCMAIAAPLLARQPLLPVSFGRGYYEDVAYCLAARERGFSNLCATGVYVGHHGSRSFQSDKRWLVKRNLRRLTRRFPDYRAEADAFFAEDPLREAVARLERAWLAECRVGLILAAAGTAGRLTPDLFGDLLPPGAATVVASVDDDGSHVALRGGDGGFPQSLRLDAGRDEDFACLETIARASHAIALADPHRLPRRLAALAGIGAAPEAAMLLASGPCDAAEGEAGLATGWMPAGRVLATSRRLAEVWARRGVAAEAPEALPPADGPALRDDALYVVVDEADADSRSLCLELGRLAGGGALGQRHLVAIGRRAGDPGTGLSWLGPMAADAFADWLAIAGAAPFLLASRTFGCGDPRLDAWLAQDHPVAWFEPGLAAPRPHGRGVAMPAESPAEAVAGILARWLDRSARSRAA